MNATAFKGTLPWNDKSIAQIRRERGAEAQSSVSPIKEAQGVADSGERESVGQTPRDETRAIILRVAAEHGVTLYDILGPKRHRKFTRARSEAMRRVMAARPNMSWPMLGRIFNRDHTTCMHHVGNKCDWGKPTSVIAPNLPDDSHQHTDEVGVALP